MRELTSVTITNRLKAKDAGTPKDKTYTYKVDGAVVYKQVSSAIGDTTLNIVSGWKIHLPLDSYKPYSEWVESPESYTVSIGDLIQHDGETIAVKAFVVKDNPNVPFGRYVYVEGV